MMVHLYYRFSVFILGVILGILIGKYFIDEKETINNNFPTNPSYNKWFQEKQLKKTNVIWDTLRYNKSGKSVIESNFLFKEVPIVCIILLRNHKHEKPIRDTWSKGCNEIKFLKIFKPKTIPIRRNIQDSSWVLLCQALIDLNSDWVIIVSDYTFVIMENLRYYLAALISHDKYYLGHTVEFWSTLYNSKDGGIVLSKGALNILKKSITNCSASSYWNKEDFYLGKALDAFGIKPSDTRDFNGLSRFHPFNLYALIFNEENHENPNFFPFKCCSKNSISFRAIDGDKMYTYYYLLYTLQLFTHGKYGNIPNLQDHDDQVWKNFLKERNVDDKISNEAYYKVWVKAIDDPSSFVAKIKRETENGGEL